MGLRILFPDYGCQDIKILATYLACLVRQGWIDFCKTWSQRLCLSASVWRALDVVCFAGRGLRSGPNAMTTDGTLSKFVPCHLQAQKRLGGLIPNNYEECLLHVKGPDLWVCCSPSKLLSESFLLPHGDSGVVHCRRAT